MYIVLGFIYEKDTRTYSNIWKDEDTFLEQLIEEREAKTYTVLNHNEVWNGGEE